MKGYVGHVKLKDGKVVEKDIEDAEKIAEIIQPNLKKGQEEAEELGFKKLHGFVMIGQECSLAVMKDEAVVVKTMSADWQEVFRYFTYFKGYLLGGVAILILATLFGIFAFATPDLDYFNVTPKIFITLLLYIIGGVTVAMSKSKWSYRLD